MTIPAGYKQTDLGEIPEDWNEIEIGSLKPFVTSGSRGWAKFYSESGAPFVRITNMIRTSIHLDLSDLRYVTLPLDDTEGLRTSLNDDDLLISITADIGIVAVVQSTLPKPAYVNQHIAAVRFPPMIASGRYVSYFLASERPQRNLQALTDTGAKAGMSLSTVRKIKVALPNRLEQDAIVSALSEIDDLLASLDALIAKKRDIKQAAMQQLLTGKTRLPGFVGDWQTKKLSAIAPLQRGFDLPTGTIRPGPYPVVYSNGIMNSHAEFQVKGPGVVTGRSGTIGAVTFVDQNFWPHNTSLWVTSFWGSDPKFIFYLYGFIDLSRFASGSGVPTLNRNDVHAWAVAIPPTIEEQSEIAAVLSEIDNDLSMMESHAVKAQSIKTGMMQQLLTGRIRLV